MSSIHYTPNLAAALDLTSAGYPVLPVYFDENGHKRPRVRHWSREDRPNRDRVMRRWRAHPDAAIGLIIRPGLIVFDVDYRNGGSLDQLRPLPESVMAVSGNGVHAYFAVDPTLPLRGESGLQGVDLKKHGGLVVVPPSRHHNGNAYEWVRDLLTFPLAPCPDHLLERIVDTRSHLTLDTAEIGVYPSTGERWLQRALVRAAPGNRNHEGYELADQLRADRLPFEMAERLMRRYQERVAWLGGELYGWQEATDTLRGVYRQPPRAPARRRATSTPVAAVGGLSPSPSTVGDSFVSFLRSFSSLPSRKTGIMGIPGEQPVSIFSAPDLLIEKQSDPLRRSLLERMREADAFPCDGHVTHPGNNAQVRRQKQYAVFRAAWQALFPLDDVAYSKFSSWINDVQRVLGQGEEGTCLLDSLYTFKDNPHNADITSPRGAFDAALCNDLGLERRQTREAQR